MATSSSSSTPAGVQGLYHIAPEGLVEFPLVYQLVDRLLPGACPAAIQIIRVPLSDRRTEGTAWASATERAIYFMTEDPSFYKVPGLDPTLYSLAFKVCLGQTTRQGDRILSREEKALRFLEEGFAQYLQTRPEAAALGGRPEATKNFLDFAARVELMHRFGLDDFWLRLPDPAEVAGRQPLNPRRIEAQLVAGAFLRDLVEEQGLGIEGYFALWRRITANPFKRDERGYAIPQAAVPATLSAFLAEVTDGRITDLQSSWNAFASRINSRYFERPTVEMHVEGEQVVVRFSRDMLPERVDVMLDNIQIGSERLESGLGSWLDGRTLTLSLATAREQLGLEHIFTIQVNWGRIWQWFRARDGVPAEGGRLELPEM